MARPVLWAFAGLSVRALRDAPEKNRPVATVVSMLKKMNDELEAEAKADDATNAKFECWCNHEIPDAQNDIDANENCANQQQANVEESTNRASKNEATIKAAEDDKADEEAALQEAKDMRKKAFEEYERLTDDLKKNIGALERAIQVLKKHNRSEFLQMDQTKPLEDLAMIMRQSYKQQQYIPTLAPSDRKVLDMFMQQPSTDPYQSQSGAIFGMFTNMLDNFNLDLEEYEKKEEEEKASFEKLEKLKKKAIKELKAKILRKGEELAQAKKDLAAADAERESCQQLYEDNVARLQESKEACAEQAKTYTDRTKARNEELGAVNKALEFLNSDAAREMFEKAFSFTQLSLTENQQTTANNVASAIEKLAAKTERHAELTILAQKIKAGAFVKVIRAIEEMVKEIRATMKADITKRDHCIKSINDMKNKIAELTTTSETLSFEDPPGKIERLTNRIENLVQKIKEGNEKIDATKQDLNMAAETRKEENAIYQDVVTTNTASVKVLGKALQILDAVFNKPPTLMQAPTKLGRREQSSGGKSVLSMIKQIIQDSKDMIEKTVADENTAQATYEELVKTKNEEIKKTEDQIGEWSLQKKTAEEDLETAQDDLEATNTELKATKQSLEAKEEDCHFLLDNFEIRERQMKDEVSALEQAKGRLESLG